MPVVNTISASEGIAAGLMQQKRLKAFDYAPAARNPTFTKVKFGADTVETSLDVSGNQLLLGMNLHLRTCVGSGATGGGTDKVYQPLVLRLASNSLGQQIQIQVNGDLSVQNGMAFGYFCLKAPGQNYTRLLPEGGSETIVAQVPSITGATLLCFIVGDPFVRGAVDAKLSLSMRAT